MLVEDVVGVRIYFTQRHKFSQVTQIIGPILTLGWIWRADVYQYRANIGPIVFVTGASNFFKFLHLLGRMIKI